MKKIFAIMLVCILAIASLSLVACGKEKVLDSITFNVSVDNIEYWQGEEFDSKNEWNLMKIPSALVNRKDGTFIELTREQVKNLATGYDKNKVGEQTVTVTYTDDTLKETVSATYKVKVKANKLESLVCYTSFDIPFLNLFHVGDKFERMKDNITVNLFGEYSNGDLKDLNTNITNSEVQLNLSKLELNGGGEFTKSGLFPVEVTYLGVKGSFNVFVGEKGN